MTILDKILGGIIAALLAALAVFWIMNADLRADLATAKANASMLNSVNADLKDKADRQNQMFAALKASDDAHTLAAAKAVKAAAVQAGHYTAEVAAIAKDKPHGADDCAAAKQILRDYLAQAAK